MVLVGPNNTGKSTILRAYQLITTSSKPKLTIDDFPGRKIEGVTPQIELHTAVNANPPGSRWIASIDGENIIRERWTWSDVDEEGVRQGFDVPAGNWGDAVPWGAANVSNARRPKAHRIEAFATPEEQTKEVIKILSTTLKDSIKGLPKTEIDGTDTEYGKLLKGLASLQTKVVDEAQEKIEHAERHMTEIIQNVFRGYSVEFDARPEQDIESCLSFFKPGSELKMGPAEGHMSPVEKQGSGARRTIMWAALRYAAEQDGGETTRHNLLLLDEPELCLHPNAVREACRVLYDLPQNGHWQVMVTTHSPQFIDLSRDNTTIVRVERDKTTHEISGKTVFRPQVISLSQDEKEELKMLNLCDPHVAEFFFGGKTVVVEGDTEYTAFKYIASENSDVETLSDIHIVRARSKAGIALICKILNQFGVKYAVLHDSDNPTATRDGATITNPAWTNNQKIKDVVSTAATGRVRLVSLLPNFEVALLGKPTRSEKPFNTWSELKTTPAFAEKVKKLLESLTDFSKPLPDKCTEWSDLQELETKLSGT